MRKEIPALENPLNADERLLHGIALRLDRIIEILDDIVKPEIEVIETFIEEETKEEEIDFSVLTKKEIMTNLDLMGIQYSDRMTKAELIELLR